MLSRKVSLSEEPRLGSCCVCAGNSLEDRECLKEKLSCSKTDIFDRELEHANRPVKLCKALNG